VITTTTETVLLLFPDLKTDRWKPLYLQKEMIIRVQTGSEKGHSKAIKVAAAISGKQILIDSFVTT